MLPSPPSAPPAGFDIYATGPLIDIVRIELERGRPEAALAQQLEAMRRAPGQPSHYLMLSSIFERLGNPAEAEAALHKAAALAAEVRKQLPL